MIQAAEPLAHEPIAGGEQTTSPAEPATAHVIAMSDLDQARGDAPANGVQRPAPPLTRGLGDLAGPLRNIKAKLTVCVGSAELTVGELLEAREQQVLRLDRAVEHPVDVLLEGQVIARGTLVAVDEHFAVRITELPAPGFPFPSP